MTVDHYPEVKCQAWTSSRQDSASSIKKATVTQSPDTHAATQDPQDTSFPSPSGALPNRSNSTRSASSSSNHIDAKYARYTDAPPPYAETQYQGKSEEQQSAMRLSDYAKELSRIMGRQIVRGLKIDGKTKEGEEETAK